MKLKHGSTADNIYINIKKGMRVCMYVCVYVETDSYTN